MRGSLTSGANRACGEIPPSEMLPEMLVLSRSDGGVLKDDLKALFSAWAARYCGLPEQAEPLSLALACCLLLF